MKITINLAKTGQTFTQALEDFPAAMQEGIFSYGLRQLCQDAYASGKTQEEREAMASQRLQNLLEGTHRFGGGGAKLDPVEVECRAFVAEKLKAKGTKAEDAKKLAKTWKTLVTDPEAQAKVIAHATKLVEMRKSPEVELDF